MDALDLLVDFASLLSCSTTVATPIAPGSHHDTTIQTQKVPVTLQQSPLAAPAPLSYRHNDFRMESWMCPQHSTPTPAMLQNALLAHLTQSREGVLEERGLMVDYQLRWSDCSFLGSCPDQHIQTRPATIPEIPAHYSPSWVYPYTLESTVPTAREPWLPQQYPCSFYAVEETRQSMPHGEELYGGFCMNARCHYEDERLFYMDTGGRPEFADQLRAGEQVFRDYRDEKGFDPWMEVVINDDQMRVGQMQQY
jgi:hypothetical protein